MYFVYILKLAGEDFYTGSTSNVEKRLKYHSKGLQRSTKNFLPCKLISYFGFETKSKALKFEKYLKTGSGLAFRRRHLI